MTLSINALRLFLTGSLVFVERRPATDDVVGKNLPGGCLTYCFAGSYWLGVRDDFRNWLQLGGDARERGMKIVGSAECRGGSGEIEISHGASEAEQLFDPERA